MQHVLDACIYYASGATSGAEGLGRMSDVERVRAKLAAWQGEKG